MRLTVARKTTFGLVVIVGLGSAALLIVYDGLRVLQRSVHNLAHVEEPTVIAAYEMEINVIGIAEALLRYIDARHPDDLWRVRKDQHDYRRFYADYVRLVRTDEERQLAAQIDGMFNAFAALGEEMIARRDREAALWEELTGNLERIDEIIDTDLQVDDRRILPDTPRRQLGSLNLEADAAEVGMWIANYRRTQRQDYVQSIEGNVREFRATYAELARDPG